LVGVQNSTTASGAGRVPGFEGSTATVAGFFCGSLFLVLFSLVAWELDFLCAEFLVIAWELGLLRAAPMARPLL
jgi:hypothetical protein